jgi:hypothetical protein
MQRVECQSANSQSGPVTPIVTIADPKHLLSFKFDWTVWMIYR